MNTDTLTALKARYDQAGDNQKPDVLFGSESLASGDLIEFLLPIARDESAYDLARIEAIKAAGLAGLKVPSHQATVVDALVSIALEDEDDDIQSYALQALAWYPHFPDIPSQIEPLLTPDTYIVVRDAALAAVLSQKTSDGAREVLMRLKDDPELGKHIRTELGL